MREYEGRINVSKDAMLFVVNTIFENGIKESTTKESTTKENILKMMPEIYEKADSKEIIKLLPYKTYTVLEDLIEYIKTSDDINEFCFNKDYLDVRYLEKSMIIFMRAKNMSINIF